jgi:hypothetical protein
VAVEFREVGRDAEVHVFVPVVHHRKRYRAKGRLRAKECPRKNTCTTSGGKVKMGLALILDSCQTRSKGAPIPCKRTRNPL